MGHIVYGAKRYYGVEENMYVSDIGYRIPASPKTRKHYDVFDDSKYADGDYSLKELDKACKEFQKFRTLIDKKFAGVLVLADHVDGSRVVNVNSRLVGSSCGKNDASSLFVFNLQSGRIHNLPVAKFESAVGGLLTLEEKNDITNYIIRGGQGYSVKDAVRILERLKKKVSDVYAQHGFVMSVEDFYSFVNVFRMKQFNEIFGTLNEWLPYMKAGLDLNSIKFAFNIELWKDNKTAVPLEQVKEMQGIPVDWAKRIISV